MCVCVCVCVCVVLGIFVCLFKVVYLQYEGLISNPLATKLYCIKLNYFVGIHMRLFTVGNFQMKNWDIFPQNIDRRYKLEPPH